MTRYAELAPGVRISAIVASSADDAPVVGWIIEHELEAAAWCAGYVPRDGDRRGWNTSTGSIEAGDLTLRSDRHTFSIRCHTHPRFHGYVTAGRWEDAGP